MTAPQHDETSPIDASNEIPPVTATGSGITATGGWAAPPEALYDELVSYTPPLLDRAMRNGRTSKPMVERATEAAGTSKQWLERAAKQYRKGNLAKAELAVRIAQGYTDLADTNIRISEA